MERTFPSPPSDMACAAQVGLHLSRGMWYVGIVPLFILIILFLVIPAGGKIRLSSDDSVSVPISVRSSPGYLLSLLLWWLSSLP